MPAQHHPLHPCPPAAKNAAVGADRRSSSSRLVPPAPHPRPTPPPVVVTARRLAAARARGVLTQPLLLGQMVQRGVGQMVMVVVVRVVRLLRLRPAVW